MLLRSSSTPVLGSLLSSFSDSPNNNIHNHHEATNPKHQMFYHQTLNNKLPCLTTIISCNSSPISPSLSESNKGIRRAQSEGNLEGLAYVSCNNNKNSNELEHFTSPGQSKKLNSGRQKCLMLETIPSFSLSNLRRCSEDDDEEEEDKKNGVIYEEECGVGWRNAMDNMVLNEEWRVLDRNWNNVAFEERNGGSDEDMYLAKGLGISSGCGGSNSNGSGGGGGFNSAGGDGGDMNSTEEYYKKMVKENPGNPLFLRNYAHFLYQTKQDLQGSEEYYSRAILADPKDGEILSQYAKLIWELHHDQDRALTYFEREVQAAPEDSHFHAAYASFLWETEEDEDECIVPTEFGAVPPSLHGGVVASAGA